METMIMYGILCFCMETICVWNTMGLYGNYGFVWNCYMDDYVFVWNLYGSVIWILVVPFLGFS